MAQYYAETLPRSVKPIPQETFKDKMHGYTVQTLVKKPDVYLSLCMLNNTFQGLHLQ